MNAFSDLDEVLDLGLHIEDMERKYFSEDWDWNTMIKFLVLCCPKSMIGTVTAESEKFSEEFSREQNALFAREHGAEGDIFDDNNGGYLFRSPIGKGAARVLDEDTRPKYSELRARVLRAILGVGSESMIERKIREGQGQMRVEAYVAKFQRWMSVLEGLRPGRDQIRYAELFLQGLNPTVKNSAVFEAENLTLEEAYKAARVAAARASVLDGGMTQHAAPQQPKWDVHPTRREGIGLHNSQQVGSSLRAVSLFADHLQVGQGADPEVFGVIGTLNAVSTPIDYLKLLGSVAGIQLGEGALLTASAQSLLPFHMGLRQALVNIRALRQLQTTIPLLLPEQYLLHPKKVGGKAQVEKLAVMDTEPIRDRYQLKDMERKLRSEFRDSENRKQKTELATVVEMERKLRTEFRDSESRKQKTELATVVEMLSEMRGDRRDREQNYKRKREDSRERDDHRRNDGNGAKRGQNQERMEKCYRCGEMGHLKSDCRDTEKRCVFCKATDHDVDKCQKRLQTTCKQCNKKGHSAGFHKVHQCRKCGKEHSGIQGC